MPYADPQKQRDYKAEWKRRRGSSRLTLIASSIPLETARDVVEFLSRAMAQVEANPNSVTFERGRVSTSMAALALKALEISSREELKAKELKERETCKVQNVSALLRGVVRAIDPTSEVVDPSTFKHPPPQVARQDERVLEFLPGPEAVRREFGWTR